MNDPTTMPTGPSAWELVTTATPVGYLPSTSRNRRVSKLPS
ncbi:hypothetical protein ABT297_07005 [Dactylosporangium sp. NPDC000555]